MKTIKMVPVYDYTAMQSEIERLNQVVDELTQLLNIKSPATSQNILNDGILVHADRITRFIKYEDIIMIKAESNYSMIFFGNGTTIFTSKTLKYWESRCIPEYLVRIHKSYIINTKKITSFESKTKTILLSGDFKATSSIPIKRLIMEVKEGKIGIRD